MLAEQRHHKILEILRENGVARTTMLAKKLDVSTETIRKDLDLLSADGHLTKVHGGALLPEQPSQHTAAQSYIAFEARSAQNAGHKDLIARCASQFVHNGQSIALDAGTSAYAMTHTLIQQFNHLTVVTNSLKSAAALADKPGFTVILSGGIVMPDEYSCVSDFATMILEHVNIDVLFLTVTGIDPETGLTDQRIDEIRIQQKMIAASRKVIVLADSSKFGESSFVRVCGLNEIDAFVTDAALDPVIARQLREKGCEIIIAKEENA